MVLELFSTFCLRLHCSKMVDYGVKLEGVVEEKHMCWTPRYHLSIICISSKYHMDIMLKNLIQMIESLHMGYQFFLG